MKHTEKAQDYFERHSNDECFITSDGRVFHTKGAAEGFAGTLADNKIEHFKRSVLAAEVAAEKADQADTEKAEAERAEKIELLKSLDLETAKYDDVKALVKYFDIDSADQKAETLKAALTTFRSNL